VTISALGSEETNVLSLKDVLVFVTDSLFVFVVVDDTEKIIGLSSERSVVDFHFISREKDNISGDVVSSLEDDEITDGDELSSNSDCLSISDDISHLGDESLEIIHERFGGGGLVEGEASSNEYDEAEYNTKIEVRLILFLVFLNGETNETKDTTEP